MPRNEITCIGCPLGCRIEFSLEVDGSIKKISGHQCKQGKEYALTEFQNPVRVLTTTILIEGSGSCLLPVRTDRPVSKDQLKDIMRFLSAIKANPPIEIGDIIIQNILGTGANLVSTRPLK